MYALTVKMEPHGFGEAVRFTVIMEVFYSSKTDRLIIV